MGKVKNVLSIDMDYVMAPCINLYNDCVGQDIFQGRNFWNKVNEIRGIDKHLAYDEGKFLFLVDIFATQLRKLGKEAFFFAEEHDMILEFLCRKEREDEMFTIYNVDHHHDIYYGSRQKEEVDRFDFACLANWVYYLGKNEKIYKYYWVRNHNSDPFPQEEVSRLTFPFDCDTYWNDLKRLTEEVDFDYVFVCKSSNYFPEKYNHLFESLHFMANAIKNHAYEVWNVPYCIDGKSRPVPWGSGKNTDKEKIV